MLHIALHFIAPVFVAALFFRRTWRAAYLIMIATMLVDLDHLLATPVYDPNRCSIGFHPLHQPWFIALYIALCFMPKMPKVRLVGIGLTLHMALDFIDCQPFGSAWGF